MLRDSTATTIGIGGTGEFGRRVGAALRDDNDLDFAFGHLGRGANRPQRVRQQKLLVVRGNNQREPRRMLSIAAGPN